MSRNTLLFFASLLAVIAGGLVSYFPPSQNGVAIWSLVSMFVGYGIRDLFVVSEPVKTDSTVTPVTQPVVNVPAIPAVVAEVTDTPKA